MKGKMKLPNIIAREEGVLSLGPKEKKNLNVKNSKGEYILRVILATRKKRNRYLSCRIVFRGELGSQGGSAEKGRDTSNFRRSQGRTALPQLLREEREGTPEPKYL